MAPGARHPLQTFLNTFLDDLAGPDAVDKIRGGLIGNGMQIDTDFGPQKLLYADYVASGRALAQIEAGVMQNVLRFYANSHAEASHCGSCMTHLREAARSMIADICDAGDGCHVIFSGSGATAPLNRIVGLLSIADQVRAGKEIRVLIGPYEHRSNILPWRESGADIVEIGQAFGGGLCPKALDRALKDAASFDQVIGSFSAASNVTGLLTDTDEMTRRLSDAGALAIWDYACGAPYMPIRMDGPAPKDAIVFSPHKFPGGPGASGVGIIRDSIVRRGTPTAPGGGSVNFVSPWQHVYSSRVEAREEAGTPNIIGDIRAALALLVREAVGTDAILRREEELRQRALAAWSGVEGLHILGQTASSHALPVFSFQVFDSEGQQIHQQLVTRILSDHWGIQARGGCACAGPYAHRLVDIDRFESESLFTRLQAGEELARPGWTRLNLSYLHTDEEADTIIKAVAALPRRAAELARLCQSDPAVAIFRRRDAMPEHRTS